MNIDLSKLTAAELDELIAKAAERRRTLLPPVPAGLPISVLATMDPAWVITEPKDANTVLQLRDPGHGWLGFVFPPHERAHILSLLIRQSLTPGPVPPASGGGMIR